MTNKTVKELVERLRLLAKGWKTPAVPIVTEAATTLTQQAAEIEAVRAIGLTAAEHWLECAIEQANDYNKKDAVFDQMMRGIERAEKAVTALSPTDE